MSEKPTVPEVMPLVRALYERDGGGVGCCLHIALDDGNLRDSDLQSCAEWATERGHADCLQLARLLLRMSRTQREKLYSQR